MESLIGFSRNFAGFILGFNFFQRLYSLCFRRHLRFSSLLSHGWSSRDFDNLEGTWIFSIWFKCCSIDFHWSSTDLPCESTQNWSAKAFVSPLTFSQSTFFHWWTLCGTDLQMSALRLRSVTIATCSSAVEILGTVSMADNSESLLVKNKSNSDVNLVGSFGIAQI